MKRRNHLFHRITCFEGLYAAAIRALRGKRQKKSPAQHYFHLEDTVIALEDEMAKRTYRPLPYHQFEIFEPKVRKIASSDFRDRIVHHAVCRIIEPILDRRLIADTYACRPGKGSHLALARCQTFARKYAYYLKCDIRKYFESVDHNALKALLRRIFKDGDLLWLLDVIIDHVPGGYSAGKGLPIGNLTSQHFANLYLGELDHFLKSRLRVPGYLRYMDDFICFSDSKEELKTVLDEIRKFCREKLKLDLKEKVVRIAPVSEGVPFLGFRVFRKVIRLQRQNWIRMRRKMRKMHADFLVGRVEELHFINSMRSRFAHIDHANSINLRRKELDAILREI